jgi:hypothetical protein
MLRKAVWLAFLVACGGDSSSEDPVYPADYATTYQQVRNCRMSLEHDLHYIRVLASPDAVGPYMNRTDPFPLGAIALKEEYAEDDTTCSGPLEFITVMEKLDVGSSTATLDWHWQKVDANRKTLTHDEKRCINCHTACQAPDYYDSTCTQP